MSYTWALPSGKQPFHQRKAGRVCGMTEKPGALIVPCLMASLVQGLIPDFDWGVGDDCIEISANRQSPAFPSILSSSKDFLEKSKNNEATTGLMRIAFSMHPITLRVALSTL